MTGGVPDTQANAGSVPPRFGPRPRIDPRWTRLLWPVAALALLLLADLVFIGSGFFGLKVRDGNLSGSVVDILERATLILLVATGMTLVIATGGVDLSVGSIMAVAGAVAASLAAGKYGAGPAIAGALLVSGLLGVWNGVLVAVLGIQPIVATLILLVAGRGIAQVITDSQKIPISSPALNYLGSGYLFGLPFAVTIAVVVVLGTALLTRKTALGLFIEAVGGNATASRYAGLNATGVKLAVYVFSGVCAGVAGLIAAADIQQADPFRTGIDIELDGILAVVIGGTALAGGRFSLPGSVVGALLIQTLTTTILTAGLPDKWTLVVKAFVVVAVCLLQSEGLREKMGGLLRRGDKRGPNPVSPAAPPVTE